MKQYLSAVAFARLIGKDHKTIISWFKKGWISGVQQLGNIYQIPHKELEKAKTLDEYPGKESWPT